MSTAIQWTDETWNPIRGCSRVSEGCRHCYAEKVAHRFSGPGKPYEGLTNAQGRWNGTIRVVDSKLTEPLSWRKPRRVFVNSMSDLFHENVTDETIDRIFAVMALAPQHTFQVLTKRPERMRAYLSPDAEAFERVSELAMQYQYTGSFDVDAEFDARDAHENCFWPLPNVWLGVSVEDQATADQRIPLLLQTPAAVRFISAEPLLGPIDLSYAPWPPDRPRFPETDDISDGRNPLNVVEGSRLDWVIVGGESGHGARQCDARWVLSIVEQCRAASVACFVKQLGARPIGFNPGARDIIGALEHTGYWLTGKADDPAEWPEPLRVRQYPEARA